MTIELASLLLLAQSLRIEPTFNAGAKLTCGTDTVLIDSLFLGLDGYQKPTDAERSALTSMKGPVLVIATHPHRDHWDEGEVKKLLANNREAVMIAEEPETRWRNVKVKLFRIQHSGERWKDLKNWGVLVEMCGQKVFHPGDADVVYDRFRVVGKADIALMPFWYLMTDTGRSIVRDLLRAREVWAVHGDLNDRTWIERVRRDFPGVKIPPYFNKP